MANKRKLAWTDRGESSKRPIISFSSNVTSSRTLSGDSRIRSESPFLTAARAPTPSILDFSTPQPFVTIKIGSSEPFTIHKNIITHYSPFFSTAFNGQFLEGKTQSIKFEDGDIDLVTFGTFVNWLYTQRVQGPAGQPLNLIQSAHLYTLFERFLVIDMAENILRDIENLAPEEDWESRNTLRDFQKFAYGTNGDGKLKHIAVLKTMLAMKMNNEEELIEDMPAGMIKDFTKSLMIGCVSLKGWEKGEGFVGVENFKSPRTSSAKRATLPLKRNTFGKGVTYDAAAMPQHFGLKPVAYSSSQSSEEEGEVSESEIEEGDVSDPDDLFGEGDEEDEYEAVYNY
ncbi:hypothetical protein BDZ45DRAFT_762914 [Acephala macrosclerotiorum]|nr:hypothetical protein BDZ45DRAFT_762914 [Acephala macrosclerotiorum]